MSKKITADDVLDNWGNYALSLFVDILNGEYDLNDARADIKSLMEEKINE